MNFIDQLKESLLHQTTSGKVYSAYLILGERGREIAFYFAKLANCKAPAIKKEGYCEDACQCKKIDLSAHTDVKVFGAIDGGETIGIDVVRTIISKALYRPAEGKHRFFIIEDANKLTEEAQQAILKLLEEPPSMTSLILLGRTEGQFLKTVLSRCQIIRLSDEPQHKEIEKTFASEFNILEIIKRSIIKRDVDMAQVFTELDRERTKTKGWEELEHIQKWLSSGFYGRDTGQWVISPTTMEEAKWWRTISVEKLARMATCVSDSIKDYERNINENLIWRELVLDLRRIVT